ncbi:RRP15-like protein [Musca vetustissima]|uniref:RRP15-like protein n=1 Tax=Musca vetustissima TaxID=27455 RepID=UPI002AB7A6BD|nr:RRP15-like protein [Musca vetustissima]
MALLGLKRKQPKEQDSDEASHDENATSDEASSDEEAPQAGNSGWADSIAKVLSTSKPKTKKTLVLSRAKKIKPDDKKKAEEDYGFEIDGEIKKEEIKKEVKEEPEDVKPPRNLKLELRVKPSWKDIERERALRKVATKGVVQLFNAVRIQQKDLQHQLEEAGPLDSRREAVLKNIDKRKFLDVLMGGKRAKSEAVDNAVKNENDDSSDEEYDNKKKKSEWSVLQDDFMTNKKNKHWDEEDEDDDDADGNNSIESDGDDD